MLKQRIRRTRRELFRALQNMTDGQVLVAISRLNESDRAQILAIPWVKRAAGLEAERVNISQVFGKY